MWMLLIVIINGAGITSQLIPFAELDGCQKAKTRIELDYKSIKMPRAICHCVDVDQ